MSISKIKEINIRKEILILYQEYKKELNEWNERASRYGGHQEITLDGFMFWLNNNYIQEII
jgi:hypothetical protein